MGAGEASAEKLHLRVTRYTGKPVYQQIVEGIESAIEDGRVMPGDLLPSIRLVAGELGINQMTVSKAYKVLSSKSIVRGQSGGGTRVIAGRQSDVKPIFARRGNDDSDRYLSRMAELGAAPGVIAFTDAYPKFAEADLAAFRKCLDQTITTYGTSVFAYGPPAGKVELRELLSSVVRKAGTDIQADQVVITSGAQQALDLSARLLLRPGDAVIVESPCYFGALEVFRAAGAKIVELPITNDGVSAIDLRAACEKFAPKAFYTIPTVHNPTGITTLEPRRLEVLDVLQSFDCAIIEDDYCPELHFSKDRVKSYLTLATSANVNVGIFYLRSLGKIYLPGIRLGFLVPPVSHLGQVLQLKRASDMHGPLVLQNAAELFLKERIFDLQALPELKSIQSRARLLHAELQRQLPPGCQTRMVTGGLSFWISLPATISNEDLYFAAIRHSVAFALGSAFVANAEGSSEGLRVSFGRLSDAQIVEGAKRLSLALTSVFNLSGEPASYLI